MKTLYLDCFSGISGNMFVGMLLQAGIPFAEFAEAMESLGVHGYSLVHETVQKQGIQGLYYNVILEDTRHQHEGHADGHSHDQHVHRHLADIQQIIQQSAMAEPIKKQSLDVFQALGEAEAKVHGLPLEAVHFHEVGAVDCILDIVGTCWALQRLGIEQIGVSPLHAGSGFVHCAHGMMPVPAPATAELLQGLPYYSTDIKGELVTPTGAALVKTLAVYAGPRPTDFLDQTIVYGAGSKDLAIPNVVRGYIGEAPAWGHHNAI